MSALRCVVLGAVLLSPFGGFAATTGDPVALVTEIRNGQGEVRVKHATGTEWTVPLPLLSLRPDDEIRVTKNATAVVMFVGGQGTVTVTAANSPYVIRAAPDGASSGKMPDVVAAVARILMGKKKELAYTALATRGMKQPPVVLSPRDGKLLAPPVLEWTGPDRARYAVRVFDPQGLVWEQSNRPRAPLPYPPAAPPLRPGVQYRWELETRDHAVQHGRFAVLAPAESARIRETLAALEPGSLSGYPRNTVALLRAGFLFEHELYAEARRELLAAVAADPDEPGLHLMLGHVYERIGLPALAGEAFDEAQYLSTRTP